ncbi:MAG: tubulin-like doman-containing protein [Buchananella hordeovulneris]|nr:tubulin-like doman-containing protein [Buchananella hordeovulneris]
MRKILVVGCGGSGAKTLAFMMDQLRADLAAVGMNKIPGIWQFVNVDSPVQEERMDDLDIPTVSKQGGVYVSCGTTAPGRYAAVENALLTTLGNHENGIRHLATVLPSKPGDIVVPVADGAGQLRGLGRLMFLTKLKQVEAALNSALTACNSDKAIKEANELAVTAKNLGTAPTANDPIYVLIVSSMAGGSGSSMTLDVARLLASIGKTSPSNVALFLYTSAVFADIDGTKEGMAGNTLGFLSEAMAAQAQGDGHASTADNELYEMFGVAGVTGSPFGRVIPIGRSVGQMNLVNVDPKDIYRSTGRGLARFLTSNAINHFYQYVVGNHVSSSFLWGLQGNEYTWGSFGYASVSMGRDRYLEYSAQRLARAASDHAANGHKLPGAQEGDAQRLAHLWNERAHHELRQLGLEAAWPGLGQDQIGAWFEQQFDSQRVQAILVDLVRKTMEDAPSVTEGTQVGHWVNVMGRHLAFKSQGLAGELRERAPELVREWAGLLIAKLESHVAATIGELGVSYAIAVMRQLAEQGSLATSLAGQLRQMSSQNNDPALLQCQNSLWEISALGNAVLNFQTMQEKRAAVENDLYFGAYRFFFGQLAEYASEVLKDYVSSVAKPMVDALVKGQARLVQQRAEEPTPTGVAMLETSTYLSWPGEPQPGDTVQSAVPARFFQASNEISLMPVEEYLPRFASDVKDAVAYQLSQYGRQNAAYPDSLAEARREVLMGLWVAQGQAKAPGGLVLRDQDWVPAGLGLTANNVAATPASFTINVTSEGLLDRARKFVHRQNESFQKFASQTIGEYLNEAGLGEAMLEQRRRAVVAAMRQAMDLGGPLVTIDQNALAQLTQAGNTGQLFSFSAMPFTQGDLAAQEIVELIKGNTQFSSQVVTDFEKACVAAPVTRIDMYGSYPGAVPVCYSAMLADIKNQWMSVRGSKEQRHSFWFMHRARPLRAALPFSDAEIETMVRGWFLAALAGGLEIPQNDAPDNAPVRILDLSDGKWVEFPAPLITSVSQMRHKNDWLAAILESVLLAYIMPSPKNATEAFKPWRVLRQWADSSANGPAVGNMHTRADKKVLTALVNTGQAHPSAPCTLLAGADTPEERRKRLTQTFQGIGYQIETTLLPGYGKQSGPDHWTNYSSRDLVSNTPLIIDLAEDMVAQLMELISVIESVEIVTPQALQGIEVGDVQW